MCLAWLTLRPRRFSLPCTTAMQDTAKLAARATSCAQWLSVWGLDACLALDHNYTLANARMFAGVRDLEQGIRGLARHAHRLVQFSFEAALAASRVGSGASEAKSSTAGSAAVLQQSPLREKQQYWRRSMHCQAPVESDFRTRLACALQFYCKHLVRAQSECATYVGCAVVRCVPPARERVQCCTVCHRRTDVSNRCLLVSSVQAGPVAPPVGIHLIG